MNTKSNIIKLSSISLKQGLEKTRYVPLVSSVIHLPIFTPKQRAQWFKNEIVPYQILQAIWSSGIKYQGSMPYRGEKLNMLANKLWIFYFSSTADFELRERSMCIHCALCLEVKVNIEKE